MDMHDLSEAPGGRCFFGHRSVEDDAFLHFGRTRGHLYCLEDCICSIYDLPLLRTCPLAKRYAFRL